MGAAQEMGLKRLDMWPTVRYNDVQTLGRSLPRSAFGPGIITGTIYACHGKNGGKIIGI